MRKIVLAVIIGLVACNGFATLPNVPGRSNHTHPVVIDSANMDKIIQGCNPVHRQELSVRIVEKMRHLNVRPLDRLSYRLRPRQETVPRLDIMPPLEANMAIVEDVAFGTPPEDTSLEAYLTGVFPFCEGYNDLVRQMAGDYSAQQLIENYNQLRERSGPAKAYAAGINAAAACQGREFPWNDPELFNLF